jgi:hypothetical protein
MKRTSQVSVGLMALLVAVALAFGARQAYAGSQPLVTCGPPHHGTCINDADCQNTCNTDLPNSTGVCNTFTHCCDCFL